MIQIVMKPVQGEGVVDGEYLYTALFNGGDIGMKVRARRASHAEEKVMEMLRHSIEKVGGSLLVNYDLEKWKEGKCRSSTSAEICSAEPGATPPAP